MQELMAQQGRGQRTTNPEQQKANDDAKRLCFNSIGALLLFVLFHSRKTCSNCFGEPEKARGVEDVILRAAQMGQIAEKDHVPRRGLFSLLEQINNQTTKQTKVTIQRRRKFVEDDD
ncbi:hypothetical protein M0R45_013537 [Rubus argutus]|uniref:Uncharacterized protein n=1 Tax=Rubus argutus TaxID=59490 RepID=A0AAW1XJG0_RUBAR